MPMLNLNDSDTCFYKNLNYTFGKIVDKDILEALYNSCYLMQFEGWRKNLQDRKFCFVDNWHILLTSALMMFVGCNSKIGAEFYFVPVYERVLAKKSVMKSFENSVFDDDMQNFAGYVKDNW